MVLLLLLLFAVITLLSANNPQVAIAKQSTVTRKVSTYAVAPDGSIFPVAGVHVTIYRISLPSYKDLKPNWTGNMISVGDCTTGGTSASCMLKVPADSPIAVKAQYPPFRDLHGNVIKIPPTGWTPHQEWSQDLDGSTNLMFLHEVPYTPIEGTYKSAPAQTFYYDEYGDLLILAYPYLPNPQFHIYFRDIASAWDGHPPYGWTGPDQVAPIFPLKESDIEKQTGVQAGQIPEPHSPDFAPDYKPREPWMIDPNNHSRVMITDQDIAQMKDISTPFTKALMEARYVGALSLSYNGNKWKLTLKFRDKKQADGFVHFLYSVHANHSEWDSIGKHFFEKGEVLSQGRFVEEFNPEVLLPAVENFSPYYLGPIPQQGQQFATNPALSKYMTPEASPKNNKHSSGWSGLWRALLVILILVAVGWLLFYPKWKERRDNR